MADKSSQVILDALRRAVADPEGTPLHGNKNRPGLFPAGAAARQAAQRCKEENWLRVVGIEKRGNNAVEICTITDPGLAYLISLLSPKQVLHELVGALDARQQQVGNLVSAAHQIRSSIDALRATVEKVLESAGTPGPAAFSNGSVAHGECVAGPVVQDSWLEEVMTELSRWQATHLMEDCALPELYRQAKERKQDGLSIGEFHDGLRRLYEDGRIYLHPWTGPLHDIPQPAFALLVGHQIAYYASVRK